MADFKVTELAADLDFDSLPYWDVVIIGAGPGGPAASLTTAHRRLTTLVIEAKDTPGGQPQFLYADTKVVDIPGFPDGISGEELSSRTYRQAVDALVQFRFNEELNDIQDTDQIEKDDPLKKVVTSKDTYLCRKVIVTCGLLHRGDRQTAVRRLVRVADMAGRASIFRPDSVTAFLWCCTEPGRMSLSNVGPV